MPGTLFTRFSIDVDGSILGLLGYCEYCFGVFDCSQSYSFGTDASSPPALLPITSGAFETLVAVAGGTGGTIHYLALLADGVGILFSF